MRNKSQAGLEYLLTYGWALVLIATLVGALTMFLGAFESDVSFSSSESTRIIVVSSSLAGGQAEIKLLNATGGRIEITNIPGPEIPVGYRNCSIDGQPTPITIPAGSSMILRCTTPTGYQGGIPMTYIDQVGLEKTVTITAKGEREQQTEIILNSASGKSCTTICNENGYEACQSIGTIRIYGEPMGCIAMTGGHCGSVMSDSNGICSGYQANWVMCSCINW